MISFETTGDLKKTEDFLSRMAKGDPYSNLDILARAGVAALTSATPAETGLTANSWGYEIKRSKGGAEIVWTNNQIRNGVPIVIMLQYGHGTGTGGYVQGRDFINPALKPIFDQIANGVWKAVTSA